MTIPDVLFTDNVNRGFNYVKLYTATASLVGDPTVAYPPADSSFTGTAMQQTDVNYYATYNAGTSTGFKMPWGNNTVMWYYAVAMDNTGNFDRAPSPDLGDYAYYRNQIAPCDTNAIPTRSGPWRQLYTGHQTPSLPGPRPATYTDNNTISTIDSLKYDVYRSADGVT